MGHTNVTAPPLLLFVGICLKYPIVGSTVGMRGLLNMIYIVRLSIMFRTCYGVVERTYI